MYLPRLWLLRALLHNAVGCHRVVFLDWSATYRKDKLYIPGQVTYVWGAWDLKLLPRVWWTFRRAFRNKDKTVRFAGLSKSGDYLIAQWTGKAEGEGADTSESTVGTMIQMVGFFPGGGEHINLPEYVVPTDDGEEQEWEESSENDLWSINNLGGTTGTKKVQ